jgi:hypothetical protein
MSQIRLCRHVKPNGTFCGSAALKREYFCYFHLRDRQRREVMRRASQASVNDADVFDTLDLPVLEDANAVQVATSAVFHALGARQIRPRRAALMLYALQIAHANLPGVKLQHWPGDLVLDRDYNPIELEMEEEEPKEEEETGKKEPAVAALTEAAAGSEIAT